MNETLAMRWLRRYKLFFFLGLLILFGQLILAYLVPIFLTAEDDILLKKSYIGGGSSSSSGQHNKHIQAVTNNKPQPDRLLRAAGIVDDEDNNNSNSNHHQYSTATSKTVPQPEEAAKSLIDRNRNQLSGGDELAIKPPCEINTKEALSAIHRAQTQSCKETIANITCAIQNGTFYAKALPNYCPNQNFIANRELGCFKDEKQARLLSGYYTNFKTLNSPTKCIQMCLQSGFLYAGVQYSSECFCGNTEPPAAAKLPDPDCSYKCIGEPKQICGGYFAINIYETGISKFTPQVAEITPKLGAEKVKIAFLLTLNGRALRQVHRLLKSLYSTNHFYYIHVDSRQDYMYRELLKLEEKATNIRLARRRYSTIWGGASLLSMLLSSMNELLYMKHWQWDFVINLSESDFLVKTTDRLVDFLTANKYRNFVKSHGREVQRFIQKQGLDKTFVECDTHMFRIGERQLPHGIQIDGGSDWVALSRNFVEYVTADEKDELIAGLLTIFHHTLLPAESFFHTALRNSEFCDTYVDNNLHVTNWKRRLGCKCQYKHVVDWCGCSPNDFKPDDWSRLLATETKQVFFARKFEPVINQAVILKLEEWLYGPYIEDSVANLKNYWQSVYHIEDTNPEPDEYLLIVAASIIRLKLTPHNISYTLDEIKEISTFMESDIYRGFVISFSINIAGTILNLELWARHQQLPQASRSIKVGKQIKHLEISSDFDQKEQISRNFAKILGPYSEPTLILHLNAGGTTKQTTSAVYNLTVLWINPGGRLSDVTALHMEDSPNVITIHFVKSNLKQPLLPGIWSAIVVNKKAIVAKCDFLIIPPIEPLENQGKNDGNFAAAEENNLDSDEKFKQFLPTPQQQKQLSEESAKNVRLQGALLLEWIDELITKFFIIKDTCIVDQQHDEQHLKQQHFTGLFELCKNTNWSTLCPDQKSDIYTDILLKNNNQHHLNDNVINGV